MAQFFLDVGMENNLGQHIAQLFQQVLRTPFVNCLGRLDVYKRQPLHRAMRRAWWNSAGKPISSSPI